MIPLMSHEIRHQEEEEKKEEQSIRGSQELKRKNKIKPFSGCKDAPALAGLGVGMGNSILQVPDPSSSIIEQCRGDLVIQASKAASIHPFPPRPCQRPRSISPQPPISRPVEMCFGISIPHFSETRNSGLRSLRIKISCRPSSSHRSRTLAVLSAPSSSPSRRTCSSLTLQNPSSIPRRSRRSRLVSLSATHSGGPFRSSVLPRLSAKLRSSPR